MTVLAQTKPCPALSENVEDSKFKPGQVWKYRTRLGEQTSTVTILRVDSSQKIGTVIHVRVDGLAAHNVRGDLVSRVEHMPFTRDAMLMSVTELLSTGQRLPTLEGIEQWKAACGGVYTTSVREAVDVMEKTLKSGR